MDLSVVIPTRDRRDRLLATLDALRAQRLDALQAEIVVVDNGSGDGTAGALAGRDDVVLLRERREGASFARNRGIEAAGGRVVVLLGDDMVPARDDLLAAHHELHRRRPEETYAVLGQVRWAAPVSDFMRWLETAGFQFSFDHLTGGQVDPAAYLYSSHASLKRDAIRAAGGFDGQRFPFLMEDTELGIRLRRRGLELDYRPELLVHHHHPQTSAGFADRMKQIGAAAHRLRALYPDETPVQVRAPGPKAPLYAPAAIAASLLLRAGVQGRLRERAWTAVLMAAYVRGWRQEDT